MLEGGAQSGAHRVPHCQLAAVDALLHVGHSAAQLRVVAVDAPQGAAGARDEAPACESARVGAVGAGAEGTVEPRPQGQLLEV